jgi:hypothetical protein
MGDLWGTFEPCGLRHSTCTGSEHGARGGGLASAGRVAVTTTRAINQSGAREQVVQGEAMLPFATRANVVSSPVLAPARCKKWLCVDQ